LILLSTISKIELSGTYTTPKLPSESIITLKMMTLPNGLTSRSRNLQNHVTSSQKIILFMTILNSFNKNYLNINHYIPLIKNQENNSMN